jgi:hypothetical protein
MPLVPFVSPYDDEDLLAEVRRVAASLPDGPIIQAQVAERSTASIMTMLLRFGSWREVLTRAGLAER